jgi:hypothetical protein
MRCCLSDAALESGGTWRGPTLFAPQDASQRNLNLYASRKIASNMIKICIEKRYDFYVASTYHDISYIVSDLTHIIISKKKNEVTIYIDSRKSPPFR